VHRLADGPRWSWLNHCIAGWRYDKREFREDVARVVGRLFVRAQRRARRLRAREEARHALYAALKTDAVATVLRQELQRLTGLDLDAKEVLRILDSAQAGLAQA
jgi:hypothetical protein